MKKLLRIVASGLMKKKHFHSLGSLGRFLELIIVWIVQLLIFGPFIWAILVWLCEWLNVFNKFVYFFNDFFDSWNVGILTIYFLISFLACVIVILVSILNWLDEKSHKKWLEERKKNE